MTASPSRMLSLLSLLQTRRDWSGQALAERLGVTPRTVRRDVTRLRALGYSAPQTVADLRAAREFETCLDPATPLAIWYNGMLAACDAPSKVLARLA